MVGKTVVEVNLRKKFNTNIIAVEKKRSLTEFVDWAEG